MNLKEYLRKEYENEMSDILYSEEVYDPLFNSFWNNRPLTDKDEEIDIENFEILSISENEIVMCGGGDWQNPVKFKIFLEKNEVKTKKISDSFEEGDIDANDFIEFLFDIKLDGLEWYEYFE